ncbi:hypothetical protein M569_07094 [Genlisea aurea]|uniref:F-box domain-containing protein n=1 Tax=Genlisea aurea TaxID=192259 RepID=S8CLR8_9LAMI|nr:hypothetical protein M569_07094 [Genlisea aurea]
MDELPNSLVLEILSRVRDSAGVFRCRHLSKTLNSIAPEIRSADLYCSYNRYVKSRSPPVAVTPFKEAFRKLLSQLNVVEAVSIGVEKPLGPNTYNDVEDEDDLFLTDVDFLKEWLPEASADLRSLSISDFWVQSCWRRSDALSIISSLAVKLVRLDLRNAWLSVDNLIPMANLTSLTLEFIRLDDENLNRLNECFPYLHELNLIGVGGLKEPYLHLLQLKTCQWLLSNAPTSISVTAPSLQSLSLKCVDPHRLLIETPSISMLNLSLESAANFRAQEFGCLRKLRLESANLHSLICRFPSGKTVTDVTAVSLKPLTAVPRPSILGLLLSTFPNMCSLTLAAGTWLEMESCFSTGSLEPCEGMKALREMKAYLTLSDADLTHSTILFLLDHCVSLRRMSLLVHCDVVSKVTQSLVSICRAYKPEVSWRWGLWKEGSEDIRIEEGDLY